MEANEDGLTRGSASKTGAGSSIGLKVATRESGLESGKGAQPNMGGKRKKKPKPSKVRHNQRRLCLKLINKLSQLDQATLSERERSSLSWAKGVIEEQDKLSAMRASEEQGAVSASSSKSGKRLRSPDERPLPKRSKATGKAWTQSFSEVVKGSLVMAVINRGDKDGTIPRDKWSLVETKLNEIYCKLLENMPDLLPTTADAGWYQGRAKLVRFVDERSAAMFKVAISQVGEIWPGAKLEVVEKHDIPSQPRAHAWIPMTSNDSESILKIMRVCNPDLPTQNWKIARLGEMEGARRQAVILVNDESLPILTRTDGIIRFGFFHIRVNVYKGDLKPILDAPKPVTESAGKGNPEGVDIQVGTHIATSEDGLVASNSELMGDASNTSELASGSECDLHDNTEVEESTTAGDIQVKTKKVKNADGSVASDSELMEDTSGKFETGSGDEYDLHDNTEDEANTTVVERMVEETQDVAFSTNKPSSL